MLLSADFAATLNMAAMLPLSQQAGRQAGRQATLLICSCTFATAVSVCQLLRARRAPESSCKNVPSTRTPPTSHWLTRADIGTKGSITSHSHSVVGYDHHRIRHKQALHHRLCGGRWASQCSLNLWQHCLACTGVQHAKRHASGESAGRSAVRRSARFI